MNSNHHVVTGVYKTLMRTLQVCPESTAAALRGLHDGLEDQEQTIASMKEILKKMPEGEYQMMRGVLDSLDHLCKSTHFPIEVNVKNVGIVVAPNLLVHTKDADPGDQQAQQSQAKTVAVDSFVAMIYIEGRSILLSRGLHGQALPAPSSY